MIMQRLHTEDPTNFVMTGNLPGEWTQISIPALIDDKYIATLPEHIQKLVPRDAERDEQGRQSYWPKKESLQSFCSLKRVVRTKKVPRYPVIHSQVSTCSSLRNLGGDLIKSEWFGFYRDIQSYSGAPSLLIPRRKTKEHNDYSVFLLVGMGIDGKLLLA